VDVRPLTTVNDDDSVSIALEVGTDVADSVAERLKFERPGLYPIRVQLLLGDPEDNNVIATAGTIVERLAGSDEATSVPPPIDLAVMATTPAVAPNATPEDVEAARDDLDQAIDMAATFDASVTLEVDPTIVASIAATTGGEERLTTALDGDELISQPIIPLDVSSAVAAGRTETYTRLVRAGEELLIASVPGTPVRNDVRIASEPLSAGGAQQLRDLGVRFVVVSEVLYRESISNDLPAFDLFVNAALPDGGTLPLMVVDPLSESFTTPASDEILTTSTPIEWAVEQLAVMLGEQTRDDLVTAGPLQRRSRVLSTPDLATPDTRLLDGLVHVAETTPSIVFSQASALIGTTDVQREDGRPVVVQLPDVAGPSLDARIALIDATSATMLSAGSMLPEGDPRPAEWSAELDGLISTGYSDADVETATAELVAEADALTSAVHLPEPFTFTLTGRSGTIEIRIANTAPEPLKIQLLLESTKVRFPDGNREVTLRPLDETSVIVPVDARSNGTSSISLSATTPVGQVIDGPVSLTARVTALTGLGQVLTAGFILVLSTWWYAHWRSRRHSDDDSDEEDSKVESGAL
ncbi:MAG: DUF6049 family protein, partial [Ilumatobacteraceae bacterium]